MNKSKYIIIGLIILTILIGTISAVNAKEFQNTRGLKEENGLIKDTYSNNKVIGTISKYSNIEQAQAVINGVDSDAKIGYASTSPIVNNYDTTNGVYFTFEKDGSVYLVFVETSNMQGNFKRITDFCKDNSK